MGKLVVTEFVTLDGVVEDPGGSEHMDRGGWAFQFDRGPEGDRFKLDELMASDALLLGRVTYEGFAEAWPPRTGEFADKFNTMPKFVVSKTLKDPEWANSTVLSGDVVQEVSHLKEQFSGDIVVHGSVQLVDTLIRHDLVDRYHLMVFPVVLGKGKRLFREGANVTPLKVVETKPAGAVVILVLEPTRDG